MRGRVLVATSLSREANSVLPWAVTIAQAFAEKLYLLHVMHPDSVNEPERLDDFPNLSEFFGRDRDEGFEPPLKTTVPVGKMYVYHRDVSAVVLATAKQKEIDVICLAALKNGPKLAWWSAGKTIERIVNQSPCSVLVVRGRQVKPEDWRRPRFRHVLLLSDLTANSAPLLAKVLPWVQRFHSMLHIFPLVSDRVDDPGQGNVARELSQMDAVQTNVLLFSHPDSRMHNLLQFVSETPVDLIVMTPQTRAKFSNRLVSDIFVRLLRVTDTPILLLR